jgi:hypothetical protein
MYRGLIPTNSRTFWWKNNIVFEFELRTFSKKLLIRPDEEDVNTTRIDLEDLHERYGHISLDTLILLPEAQKISILYVKHARKAKAQSHQPINRPRVSGQKEFSKEFMQT